MAKNIGCFKVTFFCFTTHVYPLSIRPYLIRFKTLISCFALFHTRKIQTYGFDSVEVEFEGPEFEAGLELGDGGKREEELLG